MKLTQSNRRTNAMTRTEVLVVVAAILILAMVLLPILAATKKKSSKLGCPNNLKQIYVALTIWEGDNNDKYPTQVGVEQGGVMELAATGNAAAVFQVMSNELSTTRILICPADTNRVWAPNFSTDLGSKNVSYFVGLDAADKYPDSILVGDDNFEIKGAPVKSGMLVLSAEASPSWSGMRHHLTGNIGIADGSVFTTTDYSLSSAVAKQYKSATGFTNRFRIAIP